MINITIIDAYPLKKLILKKLKLLEINIHCEVKFAHELLININQKLFSFKFQTMLLLSFLLEHFKIAFNKRFYITSESGAQIANKARKACN